MLSPTSAFALPTPSWFSFGAVGDDEAWLTEADVENSDILHNRDALVFNLSLNLYRS